MKLPLPVIKRVVWPSVLEYEQIFNMLGESCCYHGYGPPKKETPMPVQPEPKYLHLRRYSLKDREYLQTGGITLAYVREGHWYKVGAAFCSHRDVYQKDGLVKQKDGSGKVIGRSLARERLWTNPCWIHENDWRWNLIPSRLTNSWGRAWYDTSLRKGLGRTWELRPKGHASGWSWKSPGFVGYSTPMMHGDIFKKFEAVIEKDPVPIPSIYRHRMTGQHFDRPISLEFQWSPDASDHMIDTLFPEFWHVHKHTDPYVDDDVCGYDI